MQAINSFKLALLFSSLLFTSCEKPSVSDSAEFKEIQAFEKVVKILLKDQVEYKFLVKEIKESRCPLNVNCVRAGEAIVIFDFEVGSKKYADLQLCIGCDANFKIAQNTKDSKATDSYIITLKDVLPYPVSTGIIPNRYCVFSLD